MPLPIPFFNTLQNILIFFFFSFVSNCPTRQRGKNSSTQLQVQIDIHADVKVWRRGGE